MRVIAGRAKGATLFAPKGLDIRPTSDRVKESLFSIVGEQVIGAVVLDLFAGTGALGIEALSRGASAAFLVDSSESAQAVIRRNLDRTSLADRGSLLRLSAAAAVADFVRESKQFDLIFLDPPYRITLTVLAALLQELPTVLREGGVAVLEHQPGLPVVTPDGLLAVDERRYGSTSLSFFRKR